MAASNEVAKLQQHLELLREQYVRLQQKYALLEQKYSQAVSTSGDVGPDHFVTRLLTLVSGIYEKQLYSDITVQLSDKSVPAHKLVLCARSQHWTSTDEDLVKTDTLDLKHLTPYVANLMLKWVYTDAIIMPQEQSATIELLSSANQFKLGQLKEKCEQALISGVTVRNCIKLYQTSEEHSAENLKKYCLQVISSRWNDLDTGDFADLSAPLLYDMFKAHSNYPLHLAIQHLREDVVFMFILEHNQELPAKLSELDDHGNIPLNLALLVRHEGMANTLVSHKCNLDVTDRDGNTLLHLAIMRGDVFAASFLIKNGASTVLCRRDTQESPLHLVANYNQSDAVALMSSSPIKQPPFPSDNLSEVASLLLEYHSNPDSQDRDGFTPLQRAIVANNRPVFDVLLSNPVLNLELRNRDGSTALWLSLKQLDSSYLMTVDEGESLADAECLAAKLIERGANPDAVETRTNNTLLHLAGMESNESAAIFLVRHGGKVDSTNTEGHAPIHIAASNGLHRLAKVLLDHGANPNLQTNLIAKSVQPQIPPQALPAATPMLQTTTPTSALGALSAVSSLVSSSSEQPDNPFDSGLVSLQQLSSLSSATSSTVSKKVSTNPFGDDSEEEDGPAETSVTLNRPLPIGANSRYSSRGSSPVTGSQKQQVEPPVDGDSVIEFIDHPELFNIDEDPGKRTALHLAVTNRHPKVIDVLLDYKERARSLKGHTLNIDLADGSCETPLSLALWTGQFEIGLKLLDAGADIECKEQMANGMTLLYQSIVREKPNAALFLLNNGADYKKRTSQNETILLVAIRHKLEAVADRLCDLGAEVGVADTSGNSPLWVSLRSRQSTIAAKLISHGCDPNAWHTSDDGSTLSLLHRAIQLRDSITSCFLIKSGADVVTPANFSDGSCLPSLHLACERGLCIIVQCLVDHHADCNAKDSGGRTALHVSIYSKQPQCSAILLSQPRLDLTVKDKKGQTPFATALATKDHETGKAILEREPKAAEQNDNKGQNFLHLAVLNQDVEAVIFLLSVAVNVNSKVQNPTKNTPLHFAVKTGSEIIVRHLVLASADVTATDNHNRSVLHMAVEGNFASILSVLLENAADPDLTDEEGNNALHIAMHLGHIDCVRVLLEDSDINLGAVNISGRNCLHMLALTPKENIAVMFQMLMRAVPNFPLDRQDNDGNTPLLLAYSAGSTTLCDCLVQNSAHPGICNKQNVSIFNAPVATKQLLFRILDQIQSEPSWLEGQHCMECSMKFNISHRKHHCRHCGRLLCNKCTSQQIPIVKFDLNKPVRVCEVCGDSFKIGGMR